MADRAARVFVVDDHPLVREWLGILILQQADLALCGEAASAGAALAGICAARPDVAIVDLSLQDGSGLDLIYTMTSRHPETAVIVLTMHNERLYCERALRAGARGYIMKQESTKNIVAAIRQVLGGRRYLSAAMENLLQDRAIPCGSAASSSPASLLSMRELEVFEALGRGEERRQVAADLGLSIKTIQTYCERMKEKLNLGSAAELLRAAVEWNVRNTSA